MGLKINMPEVTSQIDLINRALENRNINANSLRETLEAFVHDTTLMGKAYSNAKEYFDLTYVALLRGIILANEEIIRANAEFISRFAYEVDGSPDANIDEDALLNAIDQIHHWKENLTLHVEEAPDLLGDLYNITLQQNQIEEMIQALHDFDSRNADLYDEALTLLMNVESGLLEVSINSFDAQTNQYVFNPNDYPWSTALHNEWNSQKLTEDEQMVAYLASQFGFGEKESKLMIKLWKEIEKKYGKDTELAAWNFTRLLGGLVYGNDTFKDRVAWNQTAGNDLTRDQKSYFIKEFGFTEEEYEFLLYKVSIQHRLSGELEDLDWDTFVKSGAEYNEQRLNMEKVYGKLTDEQFKLLWESQYASMAGKSDFAHQEITTASIFHGDSLITGAYTFGKTDDMAGWLGDATIVGDNGEVSFGPEDYQADLDAVNISYLMQKESISYQQASNQYYSSLGTEYTRAEQFLIARNITAQEAEKMILNELNIDTLVELRIKQPDSYNFIMCLKTGSNEMRDFASE